jgi:hypothetical protein
MIKNIKQIATKIAKRIKNNNLHFIAYSELTLNINYISLDTIKELEVVQDSRYQNERT